MNNVNPTVFIVCGVFNHLEYTKKLLRSIKKQNFSKIKTIIVDDGSSDHTFEYISKKYPEVTLIKGNGNLWWTGAMYQGVEEVLKLANYNDYILTINNDCTFEADYVGNLLKTSLLYKHTIIGSLVIDSNNEKQIYDAGIQIDWSEGKFIQLGPKFVKDIPESIKIQEKIDTLSTKGTFFPVEVFKKIGNFDKNNFPHYLSDYEFTCRAKKAGFKLIISYDSKIFNDIQRTGLNNNIWDKINFKQAFIILFSRKSRLNIIDNYRFIKLCCPQQYKIKNYLLLGKKIIQALSIQAFRI